MYRLRLFKKYILFASNYFFIVFLDYFKILILKIIFKIKNIILMHSQIKKYFEK